MRSIVISTPTEGSVRSFGELEATIMDVMWRRDESATVREVLNAISDKRDLAYTTVMTVMETCIARVSCVGSWTGGRSGTNRHTGVRNTPRT